MIRAAALTVVLSLAGTPAATAVCLIWCGSSCPPVGLEESATVSADRNPCEALLVSPPSVREDSRRELADPSGHVAALPSRPVALDLEHRSAAFVVSRDHSPPAHPKSPTVLRV